MKKIIFSILFFLSLLEGNSVSTGDCIVKQNGDMEISFEGYMTDFKVGVTSYFNTFKYTNVSKNPKDIKEFLTGSEVIIDTGDISSSSPDITDAIKSFFFKNLTDDKIIAKVLEVKIGRFLKGNIKLEITLNGVTKNVDTNFYTKKGYLYANGKIDILDFNAKKALDVFAEQSSKRHLNRTWSEVGINFIIPTKIECK